MYSLINISGLIFNIVGIIILYFNAIPPNTDKHGNTYLYHKGETNLKVIKYIRNNRIGLLFILLGFILQCASCIPESTCYKK